ncbi:DUF4271 domain-containing protein [Aquimarina sp. RZ0]|uniref:DUF4271 domain-containing protein n=1 Tax=Aquimarina sp. RZ0 TaxID=2607730 RepID=UPI0011F2B453|nr:DUF4271 domain-containing protein [Aquimarina sp. RZ0]
MEIITREITATNWITIVILICCLLLAIAKTIDTVRFSDFVLLFNTNKYIVLTPKGSKLSTLFNGILIAVQILSASLFIYVCIDILGSRNNDMILFFKITTLYLLVLICKMLIEKIIATIFSIESLIEEYLFYKISYRNFLGVTLLPLNLLFVYTIKPSMNVLIFTLVLLLILNLIILFSIYKKNENIILNNLFYFILYLCALEIAPYFILYKLII